MKTPQAKYLTDNSYKALVDVMIAHIEECKFTPSEMREAAILASIMYEEMHISEHYITPDVENALNVIHTWAKQVASNGQGRRR